MPKAKFQSQYVKTKCQSQMPKTNWLKVKMLKTKTPKAKNGNGKLKMPQTKMPRSKFNAKVTKIS